MTASEHAGMRIRMYRKYKGLSLEELASIINKSPSTLSKYETGKVVIDIDSLFEIAEALELSVNQLIDYKFPERRQNRILKREGFFFQADLYYIYLISTARVKDIYTCVIQISRGIEKETEESLVLYLGVDDLANYTNSQFIYNGEIQYFDHGTAINLTNPYDRSDVGFIYAKSPFSTEMRTTGIMTFVSQYYRNPCSAKIVISLKPLPINETLYQELSVSDRETIRDLKNKNLFMVY